MKIFVLLFYTIISLKDSNLHFYFARASVYKGYDYMGIIFDERTEDS